MCTFKPDFDMMKELCSVNRCGWLKEFEKDNYISINLFDNVINLLGIGAVRSCGLTEKCKPQYVVEANGNVYPCDFYVLDEYYLGNITEMKIVELYRNENMGEFLICGRGVLSDYCRVCSFVRMCQGGCKRMKHAIYLNKSKTYCGYQDFLKTHFTSLQSIVQVNRTR